MSRFEPVTINTLLHSSRQGISELFHFFERVTGKNAFEERNKQPIIRNLLASNCILCIEAKFSEPINSTQ